MREEVERVIGCCRKFDLVDVARRVLSPRAVVAGGYGQTGKVEPRAPRRLGAGAK